MHGTNMKTVVACLYGTIAAALWRGWAVASRACRAKRVPEPSLYAGHLEYHSRLSCNRCWELLVIDFTFAGVSLPNMESFFIRKYLLVWSGNVSPCMELEGSLLSSYEPTTDLYHEPDDYRPHRQTLHLKTAFCYWSPVSVQAFKLSSECNV